MLQFRFCSMILFIASAMMLCGCQEEEKNKSARHSDQETAKLIKEITAQNAAKDTEEPLTAPIDADPTLEEYNLQFTMAQNTDLSYQVLTVYLIADQAFEGELTLCGLNDKDQEIFQSSNKIKIEENDTQYVKFVLPEHIKIESIKSFLLKAAGKNLPHKIEEHPTFDSINATEIILPDDDAK